jgi:FSR family fosmidomycin resistance protein-like MFS transporter
MAASLSITMARRVQILSLIGSSHGMSHFYGFALAYPMVNSLKTEFDVSYAALGFLLTVLNIVTAVVQIPIGYAVDRVGPRTFLPMGLFLMGGSIGSVAFATDYWMLVALMMIAGVGNGMFHPVNYTILS